jgi:hypothetical protein
MIYYNKSSLPTSVTQPSVGSGRRRLATAVRYVEYDTYIFPYMIPDLLPK